MSRIPDREERITRVKGHIQYSVLLANYWTAMATTGVAKLSHPLKEPNQSSVGSRHLLAFDDEKTKSALSTALQHIDNIRDTYEVLCALEKDDLHKYNEVCRRI